MSEQESVNQNAGSSLPSGSQISEMIDKLLANPEITKMVASAITQPQRQAEKEESESADITDVMPTGIMQKDNISELVSSLSPVLASLKGGSEKGKDPRSDHRACLLNSLKPYLCKERCEAIDYMIKLGRISELFRNLS